MNKWDYSQLDLDITISFLQTVYINFMVIFKLNQ